MTNTKDTFNSNHDFDLKQFLKTLTAHSGVYLMHNKQKKIVYVGKAKNLKKRVNSYFQKQHDIVKIQSLVAEISYIEVIVTNNEIEALILENQLIKQHQPKYNAVFKDDKDYAYLYLSVQDEFPRLVIFKGKQKPQGEYFGPYPHKRTLEYDLRLLQKIFKLRNCSNHNFRNRVRPCLQHQIKLCSAPCVGYVSQSTYREDTQHAAQFLRGKNLQVVSTLQELMRQASEEEKFETAAKLRDQIRTLQQLQQQVMTSKQKDYACDIIAIANMREVAVIHFMQIRYGRLTGSKSFTAKISLEDNQEDLSVNFLLQAYLYMYQKQQMPDNILSNIDLTKHVHSLEKAFAKHDKVLPKIICKPKTQKRKWLQQAMLNAKESLRSRITKTDKILEQLTALQELLGSTDFPEQIDCFDISHTQGENTIASCVSLTSKGLSKDLYRRFNIIGITKGDDYAAMEQALQRCYGKIVDTKKHKQSNPRTLPKIVLIDGGLGQLHSAEKIFHKLRKDFPALDKIQLVGIAKGKARKSGLEKIWLENAATPFTPDIHNPAFLLLQQIRDEAHRFAITGHRGQQRKKRQTSVLQSIPTVGPKLRQQILQYFGGLPDNNVTVEELLKVKGIGKNLAVTIHAHLQKHFGIE